MTEQNEIEELIKEATNLPQGTPHGRLLRFILNAAAGAIPMAGGLLAAGSGAWSEKEQETINNFFHHMHEQQKAKTTEQLQMILEINARLDMNDKTTAERVASPEYQSLLNKALRDWPGAESKKKREYVRNILTNAAATRVTDDEVVRSFLQWIDDYSELHFTVIGTVYNSAGVTKARIWEDIGKQDDVREDSAEADLFRLLMRDLSLGGILRQIPEKDGAGNFYRKQAQRQGRRPTSRFKESAFDDEKPHELTALGQQFVHYAMIDLPLRIETATKPSQSAA
jgi:hypothetical protein